MKRIPLLMFSFAVLLFNCGTNDPEPQKQKETPAFIGTWEYVLPAPMAVLIGEQFDIDVTINDDKNSTYSLNVFYTDNGDTALRHNGYWVLSNTEDTITLHGTNCAVYDTTLKQTITKDCGLPVPVPINIANNVWTVSLGSLAPVAPSLGINPGSLGINLDGIIIPLKKTE
jgi:hypothetical protein